MPAVDETQFRQWRRQMNFTQAEAAKILGYGVSRIAGFDRGEVDPPLAVEIAMFAILHYPDILTEHDKSMITLARFNHPPPPPRFPRPYQDAAA